MKIIQTAFVLWVTFFTYASAQAQSTRPANNTFPGPPPIVVKYSSQAIQAVPAPPPASAAVVGIAPPVSGGDLLRKVKALAESGNADDPSDVGSLFHLKISKTDRAVSSGKGRGGCPAGGRQVTDSYGVTGFAARISYEIQGKVGCDSPNQNEITTTLDFDMIRTTGCITKTQIESIFAPLGPGDSVTDPAWMWGHWQSDFTYSTPDSRISFLITPHLMWYPEPLPPRRLPDGTYVQQPIPEPAKNDKPLCLIAISLSSQSRFGPSHEPDFNFRAPTTSRIGAISPAVIDQKSPIDPDAFLLSSVKAVADSGRADNPGIVASLLHTSLVPKNYANHISGSYSITPDDQGFVSINYDMADKNWFHELPTGQPVLKGGISHKPSVIVITAVPFSYGSPTFVYSINGNENSKDLSQSYLVASLSFFNIPAYACITEDQIKSVFPDALPVPAGGGLPAGVDFQDDADLRYSKPISVSDGNMLTNAIVDFEMLSSLPEHLKPHQQDCLASIYLRGYYRAGGPHKLDLGN